MIGMIGMTRQVFAIDCSYYDYSVSYYKTAQAAIAARAAALALPNVAYSASSSLTNFWGVCYGIPPALNIYVLYHTEPINGKSVQVGSAYVADGSCADGPDGDGECECKPEKDDLAAQCGVLGYIIDESTCQGQCKSQCAAERAALEQQCGGPTQYLINLQTCHGECKEDCRDKARDACHGYYNPYTDLDGNSGDFGMSNVEWYDNVNGRCIYECRCDNYTGQSGFNFQSCSVDPPCDTDALVANCPSRLIDITDPATCAYRCRTCATEKDRLYAKCNGNYTLLACGETSLGNGYCLDDLSGTGKPTVPSDPPKGPGVDPYLPKTCAEYRASCNPSCNFVCSESDPRNHTCDCTAADPEPSDPKEPAPDPADPNSERGWEEAIKENSDSNVEQNEDIIGWLEGIKNNSDIANSLAHESNQYLENIAENNRRTVDNLDAINNNMQTSMGEIKNSVDGIKGSVDGVKGAVDELGESLSNVAISMGGGDLASAGSLGDGGEITGAGYGSAPVDGDLPSPAATKTAFGTLELRPDEEGYRSSIGGMLSGFDIDLSGATCHYEIPLERLNYTIDLDFCPYQQYFELVGYFLVALTSVYVFASFV